MKTHLVLPLLFVLLFALPGCSARQTGAAVRGAAAISRQLPAQAAARLQQGCALLNTRDLASLFPTHTETILPKPQIASIEHPAFSTQHAPGTETSCVYYSFYLPGSHSEVVLQVSYWLDVPGSVSASRAWQQAWGAGMQNAQSVSGTGDGSFYANGRLHFKMGNSYATVAATETDWNLSIASDRKKQLALEKQVAADMINHLR